LTNIAKAIAKTAIVKEWFSYYSQKEYAVGRFTMYLMNIVKLADIVRGKPMSG